MQRLFLCCILAVTIVSCQKEFEIPVTHNGYPELKRSLADSLPASDYQALDFSHISRSVHGNATLLRVAFKNKKMEESFVLVEVHANGIIKRGCIVQLTRDKQADTFNGTLLIKSLNGTIIEKATIVKGFRQHNSGGYQAQAALLPDYKDLPVVVVVGSYSSGGGMSWSAWLNLLSLLDGGGSDWYIGADPFNGGGGGSGGHNPPASSNGDPVNTIDEQVMEIDFETQYADPAINPEEYLKCFDNIPDAGATCKITIYADVPVNNSPNKIMNWSTGSPGHTWIQIEKQGAGGSGSASQHIGFYPKSGWKTTMVDAPIEGKFVDNSNHEFNAYYQVSVSPENLRSALIRVQQLRNFRYDIDSYNCTDWAIQIWRAGVDPSFDIPQFNMPGSPSTSGTSTPQGLYAKIKELQNARVQGAIVPLIGWSGTSTGPCN